MCPFRNIIEKIENPVLGSCLLLMGDGLKASTILGNFIASRMKNTGMSLPTRS